MSEKTSIVATPRTVIGKANRRLAGEGQIPAVLYGAGREAQALAVSRHDFELFLSHHAGGGSLISLAVDGESKPVNAMIKEMQMSPVKGSVLHIDFLAVRMDEKIQTTVSVHTVGDSPGVKAGGILMVGTHSLNIEALPGDLPEAIEVDVSLLEIGDTFSVADVVVPAGVSILDDPETVVCSITLARAEEEEEAEVIEGEEVEPALIGEEPEEEAEE